VSLFLPPPYRQPLLDIHTHPWPGGVSFLRKNPPPSVGFEPTSAGTATSDHCLRQPCGHRATLRSLLCFEFNFLLLFLHLKLFVSSRSHFDLYLHLKFFKRTSSCFLSFCNIYQYQITLFCYRWRDNALLLIKNLIVPFTLGAIVIATSLALSFLQVIFIFLNSFLTDSFC
jgi:hypothetical protein